MKQNDIIHSDKYQTNRGELKVTLVGHGSLMFEFNNKVIHIDPYSAVADYSTLPKADLILITHEHADHLDKNAIENIKKDDTEFIVSGVCREILGYGNAVANGDTTHFDVISIEVVPAYNMLHKREDGEFYHPKGRGNGYVLTFGDKRVYVAGDTENIPEMKRLANTIDIAFLPKNLPYTMDDDMFVNAAKMILPTYLYPYHFSEFNKDKIQKSLDNTVVELLVRPMSNK